MCFSFEMVEADFGSSTRSVLLSPEGFTSRGLHAPTNGVSAHTDTSAHVRTARCLYVNIFWFRVYIAAMPIVKESIVEELTERE